MPELRPDLSRLYNDLATRFNSGLHNIRSFGQQITTRFNNNGIVNDNSNNNGDTTTTNNSPASSSDDPFLESPSSSSTENSPINSGGGDTVNTSSSCPATTNNTSNNNNNSSHRSNRRSSRHHHHHYFHRHNNHHTHSSSLSCRDREYHRQAYHPYLYNSNGFASHNNNVSIIHRNGLITVRSFGHNGSKDRNVLAAILSIIVIAILATALVQPKWFSIYNDLCVPQRYFTKSDITLDKVNTVDDNPFFSSSSIFDFQHSNQYTQYRPQYFYNNGPFHSSSYSLTPVTIYGLTPDFKTCANTQILALKRTIIGICFLAIMCTLVQFFMDTMGTGHRRWMNTIRQYSVGNIVCVLLCILIIGLCYFISVLYERVQLQQLFNTKTSMSSSQQPNAIWIKSRMISRAATLALTNSANVQPADYLTIHQIEVKFELSYYLVTLAGFLSILASAANLFRRPRQIFIERITEFNDCNNNDYNHPRSSSSLARHLHSSSNINHHNNNSNNNSNNNNGDENSLLSSDVLNNSLDTSSPTTFANDFLTNWSIYCRNNGNYHQNGHRHHGNHSSSAIVIPPPLAPPPIPISQQSSCPPPPPYSP